MRHAVRPPRARHALALFVLACSLAACEGAGLGAVLPAGSTVPSLYDDALLAAQVDDNDGVDRVVTRTKGFAEGSPVFYFTFGMVPTDVAMPVYRLCRRRAGVCDAVEHPLIAEHLPGEPGYSPFGHVRDLPVTASWSGHLITSRAAIDDAARAGLVEAARVTDRYSHCPLVHPDVRVDAGGGVMLSPSPIYVRGREARCFDFTATHGLRRLDDDEAGTVLIRNVYILTREGETTPINERMQGRDLTGDGDLEDSNSILGVGFASASYTPLWRMVTVTVPSSVGSIDTTMDDELADYTDAEDMFTVDGMYRIMPIAGRVVTHEETAFLVNCPIQSAAGQL